MVLRAGLVGLGMMGRNHARVLQNVDGVSLVGVSDPAGDSSGAAGAAKIYASVEELVSAGIDICVVACPTEDHVSVGEYLASHGVHALIEKPLASNSESACILRDSFKSNGLVGAVGHIERSNIAIREMREQIAQGVIGEVFQISTRRIGPFPDRIRDVGVVKDLATHDFDLTAWVGGGMYESISAITVGRSGRAHEDSLTSIGRLSNGMVASHLVNWLTPFKERLVVATGDRGSLVADTLHADLTHYENGVIASEWESVSNFRGVSEGKMIRYALTKREPLVVQLEGFRDAVLGSGDQIVSMDEGLAAVAVADAALQSARSGGSSELIEGVV